MTDTITLKDHSQPCEHGGQEVVWHEKWGGARYFVCDVCPGGREITLRRVRENEVPDWNNVWLEVGNEDLA